MAKAAGILLVHDGRVLLLKRAADAKDAPNTWGFPGGHVEEGESDEQAARREYGEELGGPEYAGKLTRLGENSHGFVTFGGTGYAEPSLNDEHSEWKWAAFDDLPTPLHPAMSELVDMPSTSEAQHAAMEAAAHGKSTLGIPKKVGQEFVDADKHAHDSADPIRMAFDCLNQIAMDCMK